MKPRACLLAALLLTGCDESLVPTADADAGSGGSAVDDGDGPGGAGDGSDDGSDDGPSSPGADAGAGEPQQPQVDAGPPQEDLPVTRFVAIGDSGKGNDGQYLVADAIRDVCEERGGCEFALMLGDNIYNSGAESVDDAQWQEKFELPYTELDFPFFATLGNHDYGAPDILPSFAGGIGIDPRRGAVQVEYGGIGGKFFMPDTHYRLQHGPLELVSLNTASMFWADLGFIESVTGYREENERQRANLAEWNAAPIGSWRIAFGHHPYLSNGPHGNAGSYDGVFIDGLVGSGTKLKEFFEEHVVGQFDVFLAGHDHSLQDIGTVNGTELLVSGGGATHTDLQGENVVHFQADRRGFLLVEATEQEMRFQFVVVPDEGDGATEPYTFGPERVITR